jgi:hypothetical protein
MESCGHLSGALTKRGDVYCTVCLDHTRSEGGKKLEALLKAKEPTRMVILCEICHKRMDYCPNNQRYACNDCMIFETFSRDISRADSKDCRHLNRISEWNEKTKEHDLYCSDCGVDIYTKPAKVNKYPKREPKHELDVIQRLSEEYRRILKYEQISRIETAA